MKKDLFLVFLIFLLSSQIVNGNYVNEFTFYNEQGNPVINVKMIGWRCNPHDDSSCKDVDENIPFTIDQIPVDSGSTNIIEYEEQSGVSDPDYFIEYAYVEGYQYLVWVPVDHTVYTGPPIPGYTSDFTLTKANNCKADFSTSITSCAEAGLPLSILTDTELDADTSSAFTPNPPDIYFPPELRPWRNVTTEMYVDITPEGSSSSVIGYPKTEEYGIYSGTSHNFNFLWQTSEDTAPGDYVVTMRSTVPDAKCDQTNMQPVTQTFTVHIAPSLDGCVAQLQNFQASTPTLNQQMTFTGEHVNTFQNWSYESISACNVENPELNDGRIFNTEYTLTIERNNQVIETLTGSLPSNDDYSTGKPFSIAWTPTQFGSYEATLTITSNGDTNICEPGTTTASATTTFELGTDNDNDGYYEEGQDCDDSNELINPDATEICDSIDNNCDGNVNENDVCALTYYYCDEDNDGHYSRTESGSCEGQTCIPQNCQAERGNDCDDTNSDITTQITYYRDIDGDGFGSTVTQTSCTQPTGYVANNLDCDDNNANINPDAEEICDGDDNNCDGQVDEGLAETYYLDNDGDGYGGNTQRTTCDPEVYLVTNSDDCNDNSAAAYPDAEEICDNIDNDCDNTIDEGCTCSQGEEFSCTDTGVCDGHIEYCTTDGSIPQCDFSNIPTYEQIEQTCDGLDNDCDGTKDELAKCCSPGNTKTCKITCASGEVQGTQSCSNYEWGDCNAQCPEPPETVDIITPEAKTYYTQPGEKKKIGITYTPERSCIYVLNEVSSANSINSGYELNLEQGEYTLILQCGEATDSVNFRVKQTQTANVETEQDSGELISYFGDTINESQKDDAKKTKFNQSIGYAYDEGKTIVKNTVETDADSLDYYLEIPKCLADHIDKVEFELPTGYDVIEEDPLIVWHFNDVNDRVDLSYQVEGQIPPDCLEKIRGMPIGKYLRINEEEPGIVDQLVAPLTIIFLVASIVIYIQRTHHTHLLTEEDYEQAFIQKERKKLLKNVKGMKFKAKTQAENYLKELGVPEEEKEWILERI